MTSKRTGSAIGAGLALICVFAASAATYLASGPSPVMGGNGLSSVNQSSAPAAAPKPAGPAAPLNMPATATSAAFASFDYANGTKLPDKATLSVGNATFKPGSPYAYVPVKLDRATPNTVIARLITVNGTGTNRAISGYNYQAVDTVAIFRPGDPLEQTIAIPLIATTEGQFFQFKLREAPWGGLQGQTVATVTSLNGVAATPKSNNVFRAPKRFVATGRLQFELKKATHKRSPEGGMDVWATSLSHGRTQIANEETGLYLDSSLFPNIEGPVYWSDDGLVLHSQKLNSPINYEGRNWNYGASVLDGRNFLDTQIGYGQYEWTAKMPDRRGSWPAFWLISTSGWPPEIDIYEGFGQQSYWDFDRHVGHTIHGGTGGVRYFQRGAVIQTEQAYGLSGYSQGFHKYAVDIQRDYITWFIDGAETYQSVNPFKGFRWYPIMNVAVKTNSAYTDGSGDMTVRSFKIYSAP